MKRRREREREGGRGRGRERKRDGEEERGEEKGRVGGRWRRKYGEGERGVLIHREGSSRHFTTHIIKISFHNVQISSDGLEVIISLLCAEVASTQNVLDFPWNL